MRYVIVFLFVFSFLPTYALTGDVVESCAYKGELEECLNANKNGTSRSIEDFVCLASSSKYEILPQIILDKEFKKIDKEIESYIKRAEDNKNEFFGPGSSKTVLEAVDEIESKFSLYDEGSFGKKYMEVCKGKVVAETVDCFGGVPNVNVAPYFQQQSCRNLALAKLEVYKSVSYDVLKLNKHQVDKDLKKLNTQQRRTKYDKLLEIIMVNAGYMERIWKKWPSKTKNASGK